MNLYSFGKLSCPSSPCVIKVTVDGQSRETVDGRIFISTKISTSNISPGFITTGHFVSFAWHFLSSWLIMDSNWWELIFLQEVTFCVLIKTLCGSLSSTDSVFVFINKLQNVVFPAFWDPVHRTVEYRTLTMLSPFSAFVIILCKRLPVPSFAITVDR